MIKKFICGLCKRDSYIGTRKGLREHLKKEHFIMNSITNSTYDSKEGYIKQSWWISEEL